MSHEEENPSDPPRVLARSGDRERGGGPPEGRIGAQSPPASEEQAKDSPRGRAVRPVTIGTYPGPNQVDPITQDVLKALGQLGLIYPVKVENAELVQFPLDLTEIGPDELGRVASYFAAQYARTAAVHGMVIAQKRSSKFLLSKLKAKKEPKVEDVIHRESQLARLDAMDAILAGNVDAMKRYADAASREITRRQIEAQLSR